MKICVICGSSKESERNMLQADEVYPEIFIHWQCQTSPEYQRWVKSQRMKDPVYDWYWEMMTVGRPTICSQCNEHQAVSPKAVGMSAGSWELNCTNCHRQSPKSFSGYTDKTSYQQLEKLRQDFIHSRDLKLIKEEITTLAVVIETEASLQKCSCGGQFSVKAKPRCIKCNAILMNSYFHISFKPEVSVDA